MISGAKQDLVPLLFTLASISCSVLFLLLILEVQCYCVYECSRSIYCRLPLKWFVFLKMCLSKGHTIRLFYFVTFFLLFVPFDLAGAQNMLEARKEIWNFN